MNTTKKLELPLSLLDAKLVGDGDEFPTLSFKNHRGQEVRTVIEADELIKLGKKLKKWGKQLAEGTIDNG